MVEFFIDEVGINQRTLKSEGERRVLISEHNKSPGKGRDEVDLRGFWRPGKGFRKSGKSQTLGQGNAKDLAAAILGSGGARFQREAPLLGCFSPFPLLCLKVSP